MKRTRIIRIAAAAGIASAVLLGFATGPGGASAGTAGTPAATDGLSPGGPVARDGLPLGTLVGRDARTRILATPAGPLYLRDTADGTVEKVEPGEVWAGTGDLGLD